MAEVIRGAGLLDSARDFEHWLAAIEAQRPVSHPHRLDPQAMYQIWLQQKMEEDNKMLQFMRQPKPYQPAQMPTALREVASLMPQPPVASAFLAPLTSEDDQPTQRPPAPRPPLAQPFGSRLTGPGSANLEDQRTPITADAVTNWLRNPYDAQYWK